MHKPKYLIVENHKGLLRDVNSMGIINVDTESLMEHRRRREVINKKNERFNDLQKEVNELKILVTKILEK